MKAVEDMGDFEPTCWVDSLKEVMNLENVEELG